MCWTVWSCMKTNVATVSLITLGCRTGIAPCTTTDTDTQRTDAHRNMSTSVFSFLLLKEILISWTNFSSHESARRHVQELLQSFSPGSVWLYPLHSSTTTTFGLFIVCSFQKTWWNLDSRQGCRKERAGCSMDLPTEFLSCLRSIQRSSSMRVKSPSSIPIYKDKFQPQPKARGSEVDSTTNLLGAGMEMKWRTLVFSQLRVSSGAAGGMPSLQEPSSKQLSSSHRIPHCRHGF